MEGLDWPRLKPLLDKADVVVFARDCDGRYLYVNRTFEELVGRSAAEVLGRSIEQVLPADTAAAVRASDRQAIEERRAVVFETHGRFGSGMRSFANFKFPLFGADGRASAVLGFGTDTTERRRREEALEAASLAVSSAQGERVFQELTRYLATILNVHLALVGRITDKDPPTVRTLGIYGAGGYRENLEYPLAVTPCREVAREGFRVVPSGLAERYPHDQYLPAGAVAYAGYPLKDAAGRTHGVIAVLSRSPLADEKLFESVLKIFALRAAAELERTGAVEALRASETQYRAIFNASADSLVLRDADFRVVDVNPAYETMSGRPRAEALGRNDLTMSPPELTAHVRQLHARALAGERVMFEALARRKDGSRFNIETRGVPILHRGQPHVLYIGRDITARKTEEELLRASEEQYRAIFDASEDALILWNSELQRVDVNPAYERIYGFKREEVLKGTYADNVPPEYAERRRETVRRTLAGERGHFELESVRKDGSTVHVEVRTIPIRHRGRPHVLAIARDITERRRTEALLRSSEERYRLLFEMESDAIVLVDAETLELIDANRAAESLWGYAREDLLRMKVTELSEEPEATRSSVQAGVGTLTIAVRWHRKKDGTVFPIEITANRFVLDGRRIVLAAIRDITERIRAEAERVSLERQLRQAQKMEAIGQLTGGIAHDFNNILQGILGNLTLAAERTDALGDARLARYLERAQVSAQRARDLIQQMLTFSRGRRGEPRLVALPRLVAEAAKLLRPTLPATIELATDLAPQVPAVRADPVQLDQVLLNLAINARDAMGGTGLLELAVREARHAASVCSACRQKFTGDFVELSVRDSGPGIPAGVLERMFEPFFSTKEVGKGSGMGLSIVHGIVHEHGGHVLVDSAPGRGACLRVAFPAVRGESAGVASAPAAGKHRPKLTGRVLVVDDEDIVLEVIGELLSGWGLEVTLETSALQARQLFAAGPQRFDAVLSDYSMPRLTGLEFAREIRALRPGTPVILYTGYGEDIPERELAAAEVRALARKPVDAAELFELLRTCLKQSHNTGK
jgi:PAS domain S-box-containing protein